MGRGEAVLVGVDIGGTKTAVVVGKANGRGLEVLGRVSFPTEPGIRPWRDVLADVTAAAKRLAGQPIEAVGVSCGGPLDSRAGLVQSPPNLPGWDDVPITRQLSDGLGCAAFLQNDANACALAEWRFGGGRGTRNMVFLTFGTGMGAGLILDGRLYEGTNDLAGEVGHVRMAEEGPEGYGKTGAFEAFASGSGIAKLARAAAAERLARGERVRFCRTREDIHAISARTVGEAAEAGDPLAVEVLATAGHWLGRGLAMIIDIVNPQRIVIGSIFGRCRRFLQPAMDQEIAREALPAAARVCQVVPAELGESIGDYACLSVAVEGLSRREAGTGSRK
jgi:glucokinase